MLRSLTIKPKWTALGIVKCSNCSAILASSELLNSMVKVGTFGENLLALWSTGKTLQPARPMACELPDREKNSTNDAWRRAWLAFL